VRRFVDDVRLYEAGKAFGKSLVDGHFEEPRLAVILCGKRLPATGPVRTLQRTSSI